MRIRRLEELAAAAAVLATTTRARRAGQVLLVAALVFVLLRFRTLWSKSGFSVDRVDWPLLGAAFLVAAAVAVATAFIWLSILRRLGVPTSRRHIGLFFQAQLSKYIPGSVWQYAGRTTLAKADGLPVRPVAASLAFEIAASVLAGGVVALLVFGVAGAIGAVAGLIGLVLVGSSSLRPGVTGAAKAAVPYVGVWVCLGFAFWLTARSLFAVPAHDLPHFVGVFAIAWVAGFVAIYAPGGIGVREAVLVALLRGRLGSADALVLATVFRGISTLVDVVAAGCALLVANVLRPRAAASSA